VRGQGPRAPRCCSLRARHLSAAPPLQALRRHQQRLAPLRCLLRAPRAAPVNHNIDIMPGVDY